MLPIPAFPSTLQACLDSWSEQTFQRALFWPPELLPVTVVLCRWQDGGKSRVRITWQDRVQVSTWQEGQDRSRVPDQVVSGVAHRGEELNAGHYQAFWQNRQTPEASTQVWLTADYRQRWQASMSEQADLHLDSYLLILQRLSWSQTCAVSGRVRTCALHF